MAIDMAILFGARNFIATNALLPVSYFAKPRRHFQFSFANLGI